MRSSATILPTNPFLFILAFLLVSVTLGTKWCLAENMKPNSTKPFDVGVILDMGTWVGKMSWSSINLAIEDFYASHPNYSTRLVLHLKNSREGVVFAASAALCLVKNSRVQAIIGPQSSFQAKFIAELGNISHTPIVSFYATSSFLSDLQNPYFVQTGVNDSTQARAIASLVLPFGWTELIPIFEDSEYGIGMIPSLIYAFQSVEVRVPYSSMIIPSATDDQILRELYNLKTMQTRVFIVHASNSLASRLFLKAKEVGMMGKGYVWITTLGLYNGMDSSTADTLHGVLTLKPYISESAVSRDFYRRWREQFGKENPTVATEVLQPNIYALWAYDTAWALAMAAESLILDKLSSNYVGKLSVMDDDSTDLERLGVQPNGIMLLNSLLGIKFRGVSGEFQLVNRKLNSAIKFDIGEVVGSENKGVGFWTQAHEKSLKLESVALLKRLKREVVGKKMRVGVPVKHGFREFVNRDWNPLTLRNASGFSIEVFDMVMAKLPGNIQYDYIFYENNIGQMNGTYDDLVYQVYLGNFDAVVGDVTITPNRSSYVDFTVSYSEPGLSMVVPVKYNRSGWTFLKPLPLELWFITGFFFLYTGFVVWMLEHRSNDSFRGPPLQQLGTSLFFSFSTLVFSHRERVTSNLTRIVLVIWLFVVLILTSSYTASLSTMLTVQQLQPKITNLQELKKGDYVGDMVNGFSLRSHNTDLSRSMLYDTSEEYDEALTLGSSRGGISAMIAETPYIKLFLSNYSGKYTMIPDIYGSSGFGFAFPKGSSLAPKISREISKYQKEIDKMFTWNRTAAQDSTTSNRFSLDSLWGLFLITGSTSTFALILFVIFFLYDHRHLLFANNSGRTIWQRLIIIFKLFDRKENSSRASTDYNELELNKKSMLKVSPLREMPMGRINLHI